jgi:hypothetical protein
VNGLRACHARRSRAFVVRALVIRAMDSGCRGSVAARMHHKLFLPDVVLAVWKAL